MRIQKVSLPLVTVALVAAVAGCAPTDSVSAGASPSTGTSLSCSPSTLKTLTANTFTVGTDKPAYPPWFVDDDPKNGKGLESAVAYAVAAKLGYTQDQVKWVTATFNSAIAAGPKTFDVDINQFSITEKRKKAVDFSSGYFDVTQSVITTKGSKAEGVTTVAGLQALKLGAQVGTTSYTAITDQIKPTQTPAVFDDNDKAKLALKNGQIDALVVDLPTGLYITAAELDDGLIVGQLPNATTTPEQFGMVLEKGSSLTGCVSQAVDALRADGTLAKLADQWLAQGASAPVLK